MHTNRLTVQAIVVGVLVLIFSACSVAPVAPTQTPSPTPIDGIHPMTPPKAVRTFTLTDQDNNVFDTSALKGKWTLLAFGYTHCPDVCPETLARFKQIKMALAAAADKMNFVFIGVDSERDTPPVLKSYLANFDKAFIGLTSDEQTLRGIIPDFGVTFVKHQPDANGNYAVDHTAVSFLLNGDGQIEVFYSYGMDYDAMLADVRAHVSG
ncbi:MAG: SCO family protein [Anaerolineae bacterium]|nr:SCO family protein [Anaerolineae bacterium]